MKQTNGKQSNKKNYSSKNNRNGRRRNNKKEVEIDISRDKINEADLPHIVTDGGRNDYSWYSNVPGTVDDYASLPFVRPVGIGYNPYQQVPLYEGLSFSKMSDPVVPGIMVLNLAPTPGVSLDHTSAVNIAAQKLYTQIRSRNSGAKNYDKTDVIMVVLAMASVYSLYEDLCRAYSILGDYNWENRYIPSTLLRALGYSDKLQYSLADFRGILDIFAYQAGSVNIPDTFDYIRRQRWLYEGVYTDNASAKAQLYAFKPSMYYLWVESEADNPAYLKAIPRDALFGAQIVDSVDQIRKAIDTLLKPILGSEDVAVITGDIVRAFGDSNLVQLRKVGDVESLSFNYTQEVLLEIMNASVANVNTLSADITVDYSNLAAGPQIIYKPQYNVIGQQFSPNLRAYRKQMLNMIDIDPNPNNVMVATRFVTTLAEQTSPTSIPRIMSCGSEIVTSITVWRHSINDQGAVAGAKSADYALDIVSPTKVSSDPSYSYELSAQALESFNSILRNICDGIAFDWAPTRYLWKSVGSETDYELIAPIQDICNYYWLQDQEAENLNNVAIMSLWVPQTQTIKGTN